MNLLILDDLTLLPGYAFGAPALEIAGLRGEESAGAGEALFNTAMSGYHEVLTDPSYTGQIVIMTTAHVGNYGSDSSWSESASTPGRPEVKAAGFVVRNLHRGAVRDGREELEAFLAESGVPGIADVDTRALTIKLREEGSRNAVIVRAPRRLQEMDPTLLTLKSRSDGVLNEEERAALERFFAAFPAMEGRNLVSRVTDGERAVLNSGGAPRLALVDYGAKRGIARELARLGCEVSLFPGAAGVEEEFDAGGIEGLVVSNGPGDPAVLRAELALVSRFVQKIPMLGVCLGHQLISEAIGAATEKMKFGHHGTNHPVRDERRRGVFVTSQNHGFAVREESIPSGTVIRFRNANDGSVEGIENRELRLLTAQFHPEAAPGPHDCRFIFKEFVESI